ncbi:sugar phosphate isomerase/epimerase [Candidatus Haliotispira prima]|uniref:Sugar phosphate isomerase/epimerase n=1 Tax=Candidatus Haliotispira prima TaxID=3034016 RepID=A0ABY8MIV1_9SPIO|nr:sugar phosphate isomerase/epimerase [Candidatus Haliotispira prima]
MKLSISNIAWEQHQDKIIYNLIKSYGFEGIELAPTRLFKDPLKVLDKEIEEYLRYINFYNLSLPAMQALLFGRPELKVFDDSREYTLGYLKNLIDLGVKLGVKVLVFGSPKNRFIGDMDRKRAYEIAIDFFYELGEYAYARNRYFCIEPNAKEYGCDFITNTDEAVELIKDVDSKGFMLHIDSAVLTMNKENIEDSLTKASRYMKHFHISEPFLKLITDAKTDHHMCCKILKNLNYNQWVSVEMKNNLLESNIKAIEDVVRYVSKIY